MPIKAVAVHDNKILSSLHHAIRQHKVTTYFRNMANWAGGNLQRWAWVRRQCGRQSSQWALYRQETRSAHISFVKICQQAGVGHDIWNTVREQCMSNPFLQRELALFVREQKALHGKNHNTVPALPVAHEGIPILEKALSPENEVRQTFTPFEL